jgi:hypothetical protein
VTADRGRIAPRFWQDVRRPPSSAGFGVPRTVADLNPAAALSVESIRAADQDYSDFAIPVKNLTPMHPFRHTTSHPSDCWKMRAIILKARFS